MSNDPQRTEFAQQAFEFTDLFAYKFASLIYGGQRPRRVRLTETDGPSTAGGRHARQPLLLVPDRGDGKLVLGWIDVTQRQAEIRTYEILREQFAARYSTPIDLERGAYDRLRRDLDGFLKLQKFEVRNASAQAKSASRAPTVVNPAQAKNMPVVLSIVFLAGILVGLSLGYITFGG